MSRQPPSPTPLPVQVWGETHPGKARAVNEDSFYCPTKHTQANKLAVLSDRGYLLIVADGIGGSDLGQRASREVVQSMRDVYYESPIVGTPDQRLAAAVQYANDSLYQMRSRNPALGQAGSTVVAAVIFNNQLYLANAGDSRAYLIRNGQAFQRTHDHTLVEDKKARGFTPIEADQGVITRSMGEKPTMPAELYMPTPLQDGDAVLLCSDGLSDVVGEAEIARVVSSNPPKQAAQKLIKLANQSGGPDNVTAVVATIGHVTAVRPPRSSGLSKLSARRKAILLGVFIVLVLIWAAALLALINSGVSGGGGTIPATATTHPGIAPSDMPSTVETAAPTPTGRATSTLMPTSSPIVTPVTIPNTRTIETPTPTTAAPTVSPTETPPPCKPNEFWDPIMMRCRNRGGGSGSTPEPTKRP